MTLAAHVTIRRADFTLDVDIEAAPGEVLAVLGPNGSGKSTLVRALAGLAPIDAGEIRLDGRLLDAPASSTFVSPEHRGVGVVFQHHALFDHLDARDNVAFGLRARGMRAAPARTVADGWLQRVGLTAHAGSLPRQLSGGQAQRVALARALAVEPALLLLDEPLSALDVETRRAMRRELRQQLDEYGGVRIVVTHDPVDVYALASRVLVLDHGAVAQVGTVAEVTAHPRTPFVASLVGTNLVTGAVVTGDRGSELETKHGVRLAVSTEVRGRALATIRPQSITLAHSRPESSARNALAAVVDEVQRIGERARVGIRLGELQLTAEVTLAALAELDLRPGDEVLAVLKATDIDVEPA